MVSFLSFLLPLSSLGAAQSFFAPLENHPSIVQARLGLEAAQAQVRAIQSPVSLNTQGGFSFFQNRDPLPSTDPACRSPATAAQCVALPSDGRQVQVGLSFTPIPFGDVADALNRAQIGAEQAALGLRSARAQLEASAIEGALRIRLAQAGLEVARAAQRLAQASLEATRIRAQRDAANPGEVRQAEAQVRSAAIQVSDAERSLALARQSLSDLLGSADAAPPAVALPPPQTPPSVRQAQFGVGSAQVQYDGAIRGVLPVLNASYTRNTSPNDSLTASINSRTLQPSISYSNTSQARTEPSVRIDGTFTIGFSATIALGVVDALEAAQKQVDAANQAVEAARRNAKTQEDLLRSQLQTADLNLANAVQGRADAEKTLAEARERERLGLTSPLATVQAELGLAQALLALEQAQLSRTSRILDLYRFYALPVSEVNR
ncbi:MAG: TolC family protein [Meiothermus sp.]|nr:TolC family protein [Meiothermus sp.]